MSKYKHFCFWCLKVLPLVYDESLSYYEVLCKVVDYINHMIDDIKMVDEEMEAFRKEFDEIKEKLENMDTEYIEKWLQENLARMIFVEINNEGYIVYYIPDSWQEITFNTTGLDIMIAGVEENRLVLSY